MPAGIAVLMTAIACQEVPTSALSEKVVPIFVGPRATVLPGEIAVYTDRTQWESAVTAAGATATYYDFTGLALGRIAERSVDYGPFRIAVDHLSATSSSNPGIDSLPATSCSLEPAGVTCNRFIFNMADPTSTLDIPKLDSLVSPQPLIAWGAFFSQTGTSGGGSTTLIGATSVSFGSATFNLPESLASNGSGFLGFILGTPTNTMVFSFVKSGSLQNDIIEVYKPAYAVAPVAPPPSDADEMIADLKTYVAAASMPKGNAQSINSKLDLALNALDASQTSVACSYLQDAINYTRAQSGKKIAASTASGIISQITAIRAEIGC
jgi:hypothetical protein